MYITYGGSLAYNFILNWLIHIYCDFMSKAANEYINNLIVVFFYLQIQFESLVKEFYWY